MTPLEARILLASYDVPDCGCKLRKVALCTITTHPRGCAQRRAPLCIRPNQPQGCKTRRRTGRCRHPSRNHCDCPYLPGPPCEHVRALILPITDEEWVALYSFAYPEESDPPPPPCSDDARTRKDRVERLRVRASLGFSLWHRGDTCRLQPYDDSYRDGELIHHGRNGATVNMPLVASGPIVPEVQE